MAAVRNLRFILTGVDKSASKAIDGVTKKAGALNGAMKFAAGGAITGLAGIGAAAVKTEADFSSKLRQMAAVAEVPADQLKGLRDIAVKMGAETVFSASDAADAMLELAKGGLTSAEIKAGALQSTLSLAAAGGLGLGDAATYMSNAMNTFGLKAGDAESVAAALAGGANASSASVESLGQALGQVGPGATNAGLSLQETVGVLAAFDNAGIKGSDAGTSLKTMLTRLVPTTKAAKKEMERLGLDFTKADGSFESIDQIAGQLQKSLGNLSDEQRTTALSAIFGSDATRAATVLMKEGEKGVDKYTAATSDLEAAQRVAKSKTEGTAGAIEAMKGSLETAALVIGEQFAPHVELAAKKITELTNGFIDGTGPGGELKDALADMAEVAKDLWPEVKMVGEFVADFVGFLADHPGIVETAAVGIGAYALAMKAAAVSTGLMAAFDLIKLATGIKAVGAASAAAAPGVTALSTAGGAALIARMAAVGAAIGYAGGEFIDKPFINRNGGETETYDGGDGYIYTRNYRTGELTKKKKPAPPRVAPPTGGSSQDRAGSTNPTTTKYPRNGQSALTANLVLDGKVIARSTVDSERRRVLNGATPGFAR